MTEKEILEKANKVDGLGGMTVNERLYVTGLMNMFDNAKKNNKKLARLILKALGIDKPSIYKILN